MNTDIFLELKSFNVHKGQVLIPNQIETGEWLEQLKDKEQVYMKLVQARDLGMHKGYFKILAFIYDKLPLSFRIKCGKKDFHNFLRMLGNEYKVVFKFKDGREMIEYESISFGKMSQKRFREYFNNKLSLIYEEILIPLEVDYIMDEINEEFEKLLSKLV